jgi:Ca2+-binding EF-hand superfamily protein
MIKFVSVASAALVLSLPVFSVPAWAAPGDPDPGKAPPTRERTSALMRYDTNKDGIVDRTEWAAGQDARFRLLDTNGDGKLSKDELFVGNGTPPNDRQIRSQATYFQLLDTDKDGTVSKAEFLAQAERNFARCDADKDGRISTAECRQALRRKPVQPVSTNR